MNSDESQINRILILSLFLLFAILALGLLIKSKSTHEVPPEVPASSIVDLETRIEIENIVANSDRTHTVTYKYFIDNKSQNKILNLVSTNNLSQNLSPFQFEIISMSSQELILNNSFNGITETNFLELGQFLSPGQKEIITLTLKILTGDSRGPFENSIHVSGNFENDSESVTPPIQGDDENGDIGDETSSGEQDGSTGGDDPDSGNNSGSGSTPPQDGFNPNEEIIPDSLSIQFFIINTDSDTVTKRLDPVETIDIPSLGYNFTIEARLNPKIIGSVVFSINDDELYQIDNGTPYTPNDTHWPDAQPWSINPGVYIITASAFSLDDAQGTFLGSNTLNLTITNNIPSKDVEDSASISFVLEPILNEPVQPGRNLTPPTQTLPPNQENIPSEPLERNIIPETPSDSVVNNDSTNSNQVNYTVVPSGILPRTGFSLRIISLFGGFIIIVGLDFIYLKLFNKLLNRVLP